MGEDADQRGLLEQLRAPDSVLQPSIIDVVRRYLASGGDASTVEKCLSDGFVGYEAMSTELVQVLADMRGDGGVMGTELVESSLEKAIAKMFNEKRADAKFVERGEVPRWLPKMMRDKRWSETLRSVAKDHQRSAVLDYGIRRLNLIEELATVPQQEQKDPFAVLDALDVPSTFFDLLVKHIADIMDEEELSSKDIETRLQRVAKLACFDERSFLCTLRILSELSSELGNRYEQATIFRRIEQEVRAAAIHETQDEKDGFMLSTTAALLMSSQTAGVPMGKDVLIPMLHVVAGNFEEPDLASLHSIFSAKQSTDKDLQLLRHPEVLKALLEGLYIPGRVGSRSAEARKLLSEVIARASSTNDASQQTVASSLMTTSELCANNPPGVPRSTLQKKVIPPMENELSHSAVAFGILLWIQLSLCENPKPFDLKVVVPYYLHLSTRIAELHPLLRQDVLEITRKAFEWKPPELDELMTLDIQRIYVEHLIDISRLGIALPVLHVVDGWLNKEDASLLRKFVRHMLVLAGPPLSNEFASAFLQLLAKQEICTTFHHDRDGRNLLRRFAGECEADGIEVPQPVKDVLAAS